MTTQTKRNPNKKAELTIDQLRQIKEEGLTVAQVTGKAPVSTLTRDLSDAVSISTIKAAFNEIEKEEAAYVNRILDEMEEEEEKGFPSEIKEPIVATLPEKITPIEDVAEPVDAGEPVKKFDITLTPSQQAVVKKARTWFMSTPGFGVHQIGGYAGVGKSTVIEQLLGGLPVKPDQIRLTAPTGTAALVLADKTPGFKFSTNHGLFYKLEEGMDRKTIFTPTKDNLFGVRLVVMDEGSMSGSKTGKDIVEMCRRANVKLLVVGDPGQLEPVNDGEEFFLLNPDSMLTEVMRQAADNPIIKLSMKIREATDNGKPYIIPRNKVWNVDNKVFLRNRNNVSIAMLARIISGGGAIICGKNATRIAYNKMIRRELGYTEEHLMEGEMVVVKENIRGGEDNIPITNGMRGVATGITRSQNGLVRFTFTPELFGGSRIIECNEALLFERITFQDIKKANDELASKELKLIEVGVICRLGYVITAHGSQGAQWPTVVVFDESSSFGWKDKVNGYISRNRWLYTAVTRASEKLMILV